MPIIDDFRMFGDIFKELRNKKGLSQEKIAEDLDVSPALVSKWENHSSTPGPEMLVYISDYFNVSVDYLVGKSKYQNLENNKTDIEKEIIDNISDLNDNEKTMLLNIAKIMNDKK